MLLFVSLYILTYDIYHFYADILVQTFVSSFISRKRFSQIKACLSVENSIP